MMNRKQSGMTMLGFLITLSVIMFFLYCGMKVVPMYTEFYSVKKSLAGLAAEPGITSKSKEQVRDLFFRRLYMSYANNVKTDALKIEATDQGLMMTVEYEQRRELLANLDVVGKFHAQQELVRGGAAE
jgi:Domain of unknown function (DUF4845)